MSQELSGIVVAVTRPRDQSQELVRLIESHGGAALLYPLIAITVEVDGNALRAAAAENVDALVFTSANGVRAYLAGVGAPSSPGERARTAYPPALCVGSQTAATAQSAGITVLAVPKTFAADQLAQTVLAAGMVNRRLLLVRGNLADEQLASTLRSLGCAVVEIVGYRTTEAPDEARRLVADAQAGRVQVVTFASGSAVAVFARTPGADSLPAGVRIASIGPKTSRLLAQHGIGVDVTAAAATGADLVAALCNYFAAHKRNQNH